MTYGFRPPLPVETKVDFHPDLFVDPGKYIAVSTNIRWRKLSDSPLMAREFIWQCHDVAPSFDRVMKYIEHWMNLQCTIDHITIGKYAFEEPDPRSLFDMSALSAREYDRLTLDGKSRNKKTVAVIPSGGRIIYLH